MKVVKAHVMEVDDSAFDNNFTGGLWFDTDIENLCIAGDSFNENATNGLYFEATQGPALISRSIFYKNHSHGLQSANSARITVRQSALYDNGGDALFIGGSASVREVSNWQRPSVAYHLLTQDWVLDGVNFAAGPDTAPGSALLGTSLSTLSSFTSTLLSDYNDWFAPNSSALFNVPGQGDHTLGGWRSLTGQDAHSSQAAVNSETLPPSPICIGLECAGNTPAAEKPARP
jgi:hypothetical protein